ncbi:MAG: AAA family ATPase [Microcoleaceae cyanobacterium]
MFQTEQLSEFQNYKILDCLHSGSKTLVYRAERIADAKLVILKLLRNQYPSFHELLQFRNQYIITTNLNIPGIVHPESLEPYKNSYILVMEDYGGISLQQYVKKQSLSLVDILNIAIQLAHSLHELHQSRIIHKDIKPANILIHPQSKQVKLIDFSIASLLPKETQEIQNPNILEGTLAYISPEQTGRMNRGIDYRTDFYSLGITLYELITGELPFKTSSPMELIHYHLARSALLVHQVNTDIPVTISRIVAKLIAKNAEDRYQSSLGLKFDLEHCLIQWKNTREINSFELGQRDLSDRFLIPEKLYGRESEVNQLLNTFQRISQETIATEANGNPVFNSEIMLIAGISGIGKTAVVNVVHQPITRDSGYFIKGKFDQFNRDIPLSAFVQAFRDLIGQLSSENDRNIQQWKNKILAAVGENGQVLIEVIPELENIIGIQPDAPELSGNAAQNRFNLLFKNFIKVFTTVEHPLVIFLDDLQWADLASLELIKLLMNESKYLLILGAYRDNEVSPVHPFIMTVEELRKAEVVINTITLKALKSNEINHLVADTLNCSLEIAQPLSQLVYQKTKGNPFFTTQFLKALYEDGQIKFNPECRYWECDIAEINSLSLTSDVVEFMALQLQKLPAETQQMLKLGGAIGNQFDLNTLAIISQQSNTDTATALWKALQDGLILPTTQVYKFFQDVEQSNTEDTVNPQYRFLHDRVQQAAYSLIPEHQKQATHLQIGQLLLKNTSELDRQEKLFDIVGHLNLATELITIAEDREALARLNLAAAEKARKATAYSAAIRFVQAGLELLSTNCWQTQYELTLNLHVVAAEMAYLNGEFESMEAIAATVLQQAETILAKVKIYQIQINALTSQSQMSEAIAVGENVLRQLGVEFSSEASDALTGKALQTLASQLQGKQIEELIDLPVMSDRQTIAAMQVSAMLFAPIFLAKPTLLPLLCSTMVSLSLQFGNTSASIIGYVGYGMVLSAFLGESERGYCFGQVALNLLDRFNAREFKSLTLLLFSGFLQHRHEALRTTIPTLKEGYLAGMETGNFLYAGYCISNDIFTNLFAGVYLDDWQPEIENYCVVLTQIKQYSPLAYLKMTQQVLQNLTEIVDQPDIFSGNNYDETVMFPKHHQDNEVTALGFAYIYKLMLAYLFGNYTKALDYIAEANLYLMATGGSFFTPVFHFYAGLTYLALYSTQSEIEQADTLARVETHQTILSEWADYAPMNHQHKYNLVEAERYRVLGQKSEAIELYDRAITLTKEYKYIQEEALANELTAKFYLNWGKEKIAQDYLTQAYYCYSRWGAKAKIQDLEQRYPQLLAPILQQQQIALSATETVFAIPGLTSINTSIAQPSSSGSTSISAILDLETVLKTSQALSSEIELNQLLAILLQTVLENAGATKAILLMPRQQEWFLEAVAHINQPVQIDSISVYDSHNIPAALIHQVKRNLEAIIIADAENYSTLLTNAYLIKHQPKSILCTPIMRQDKIVAILYLENNLITGAFTRERVELLNVICVQAAISIENAKLYSELQDSQHQMTRLFDNLPGMAYSCANDEYWTMYFISEGCYEVTGYSQEELIKNRVISYVDLIHPDDVEMVEIAVKNAIKNHQHFEISYRIYTREGQEKWVWEKGQGVFDEAGNLLRLEGLAIDISDRKAAEYQLHENELFLRSIYEGVGQGICVIDITESGNFKYAGWNPILENLTGIQNKEVMGKTPEEVFGNTKGSIIRKDFQHSIASGTTISYEELIPFQGKDIWWLTTLNPIRNEANHIHRIILTTVDITDRKAAETALQASQAELLAIFTAMEDVLIVLDGNGKYLKIAPCSSSLLYRPSSDLIGKTIHEALPLDFADFFVSKIQQALNAHHTVSVEYDLLIGDQMVWFDARIIPMENNKVLCMSRDISDRKVAEKLLEEKNEALENAFLQLKQSQAQVIQSEKMSALGNLVAGVAHEINNPLGFLNGSISNAKDYIQDLLEHIELYQQHHPNTATPILENADEIDLEFIREDLPLLLTSMQGATERIKGISTSLRTFSRADTDCKVSANIHDGIDSTLLILKYRLKASEYRPAIEVIQDYDELPLIDCFPGQLNQVFMNILANGIDMFEEMAQHISFTESKYQPQMIIIQTKMIGKNTITIRISDNGKGMPEAVKNRIFDHLFTTKAVGKGTGLGLAIAHQIVVEKHGGQLICNSAIGKGTEFLIELPIKSE